MPPYLSQDGSSGLERDIIYQALIEAGYTKINIINVHYLRAIELAKLGSIDAIASNQSNTHYAQALPSINSSLATLDYVDCAITLASRHLQLTTIDDYYDKRIWAFKGAGYTLGPDFQDMSEANSQYSEDFDQLKQLDMLAMKRIDVAISDRNIFSGKLRQSPHYKELKFKFNTIGQTTPRVIRSTSKALIEKFNEGLNRIKDNGNYRKIFEAYQTEYSGTCD